MRDFFKIELERLHLTTGLQQYAKLNDDEFTQLLDILCAKCNQFSLIPDAKKQEFIREAMITDTEFLGFNAKILHKWLNVLNRGYIHTQAEYQESKPVPYSEYVEWCKKEGLEPHSEQDYDKPIRNEDIQKYQERLKASLENGASTEAQALLNRAKWLEEQRAKFGVSPEKRAEIHLERMQRLWSKECFNDDATENENWMPFETWLQIQENNKKAKSMTQGKSQFTEADLTPNRGEPESVTVKEPTR